MNLATTNFVTIFGNSTSPEDIEHGPIRTSPDGTTIFVRTNHGAFKLRAHSATNLTVEGRMVEINGVDYRFLISCDPSQGYLTESLTSFHRDSLSTPFWMLADPTDNARRKAQGEANTAVQWLVRHFGSQIEKLVAHGTMADAIYQADKTRRATDAAAQALTDAEMALGEASKAEAEARQTLDALLK